MNQVAHVHILSLGDMGLAGFYGQTTDFLDAPIPQRRNVVEHGQSKELHVFIDMTHENSLSIILAPIVSVRAIDPINKLGYNFRLDVNASRVVRVKRYFKDVSRREGFVIIKIQELRIGVNIFTELSRHIYKTLEID